MKLIINSRGRHADARDMLALLGVKRLPDEGMPVQIIQGTRVYVKPKPIPEINRHGRRRHMAGLRVTAICDDCNRHVAVGRMHQHKCPPVLGGRQGEV